jgi:hypothetical protein
VQIFQEQWQKIKRVKELARHVQKILYLLAEVVLCFCPIQNSLSRIIEHPFPHKKRKQGANLAAEYAKYRNYSHTQE